MKALLKQPWLNGWPLFWLCVLPLSAWIAWLMSQAATETGPGVSSMISISVRCAVPWLLLAFSGSAVQVLWPGAYSLWLLRNRKIFGLAFAAIMGWQAFFILWLVFGHSEYYFNEVFALRDMIEGVLGYSFLIAMTVTSFMFARKRLRPKQWKLLHKLGIYSLWIYVFSVYWWNLSYYEDPRPIDYIFYVGALGAWCLRAAAWGKKRSQKHARAMSKAGVDTVPQPALMALGALLLAFGFVAASTGVLWQPSAEATLWGYELTRWPELYLPYWPFEPFLPLLFIVVGTALWVDGRQGRPSPLPLRPSGL